MDQSPLAVMVAKETWTAEDHQQLLNQLFVTADAPRKFSAIVNQLETQNPQPKGAVALKLGIARFMLCRFNEAMEAFAAATDNKDRRYFQAMCYKQARQYDKAFEELQRAEERGWDATSIDLEIAEVKALAGKTDEAAKLLAKLEKNLGATAPFMYVRGVTLELSGNHAQAGDWYEKAHATDPNYAPATFRLAYYYDLHGDEDKAMELYKLCLAKPPIRANALLNMAVLYEDQSRYDQAIACLRRILHSNPRHERARLFLKDADASKCMFYDEERAKRVAKRNAVLDIPVTDFELSVRARNCLKKMNIRNLGDLVRTTEAELLSYKNFGETSLKEIKDMLTAKNLHLGQALEEDFSPTPPAAAATEAPPPPPPDNENEGEGAIPLEQIEFSVRARRALQTLKIATLGDLAAKTEAELLSCKNFGQTSLNEVRLRLTEHGMKLRESV